MITSQHAAKTILFKRPQKLDRQRDTTKMNDKLIMNIVIDKNYHGYNSQESRAKRD